MWGEGPFPFPLRASMTLPHPEIIRETVLRAFGTLRRRSVTCADLTETVLLRQGYYYGRSYRHDGLVATLTAETGSLCICTDDGHVLQTVELATPSESGPLRQAA